MTYCDQIRRVLTTVIFGAVFAIAACDETGGSVLELDGDVHLDGGDTAVDLQDVRQNDTGGGERPSCESLGGRCQTPDLPCDRYTQWADASCPDPNNDTCCAPSGELGMECVRHDDCRLGHCKNVDGRRLCTVHCEASDGSICPPPSHCVVPGDSAGSCLPSCGPVTPCPVGLTCENADYCVPSGCPSEPPDEGSPGCCFDDFDCDEGFRCYAPSCIAGQPGKCVPRATGDGCWDDSDCTWPNRRCEGAQIEPHRCTDTVGSVGTPGTCTEAVVPIAGEIRCTDSDGAVGLRDCVVGVEKCSDCVLRDDMDVVTDFRPRCVESDIDGSGCASLGFTGDTSLECDGTEDCDSGERCLWREIPAQGKSGTQCGDPDACEGCENVQIVCRSDSDCPAGGRCMALVTDVRVDFPWMITTCQ